jgi:adenosylhomocysteine nucleosidase
VSTATLTSTPDPERGGATGVVCALPEELGSLAGCARAKRRSAGLEILELDLAGEKVLACVGGVGKVRAARAAALLLAAGATRRLLVVGVCGGLRRSLRPGTLVHCTRAVQADLAVLEGREAEADARLRAAWTRTTPGPQGWFLTADRPALTLWRRLRLARAFVGPCVADMETAAIASVAAAGDVPWAALRAVSDGLAPGGVRTFRKHYPVQAGRAADTVEGLLGELRT